MGPGSVEGLGGSRAAAEGTLCIGPADRGCAH